MPPSHDRELKLRRMLFHDYLTSGIKTPGELKIFIKEFLLFEIPDAVYTPTHISPFQFLCEMFFEDNRKGLVMASRNSSKTRTVSFLNFMDAFFKHVEVGLVASTLDQADKGYRYLMEYLKKPEINPFLTSTNRNRTVLTGGGEVEIHTGTIRGLNSGHPNKLSIDEVELIDYPILEEGFSMTTVQKGIPTRDTLISSRKKIDGTMQRLIDDSDKMGYKVYTWNVYDVIERCPRMCHDDPIFGDCKAWARCQGVAHDVPGGFMPIQVFIDKATELTDHTWKLQWLCEKSSEQRLVFNDEYLDEDNYITWQEFLNITGYESVDLVNWHSFTHFAGIDFGHVFVYNHFVFHEPSGKTFWIYEYYSNEDRTLATHADIILKNPYCTNDIHAYKFADPAGKQEIIELESHGVIDIVPANNSRETGTDSVKMSFRNKDLLIIKENVKHFPHEAQAYSYPTDDMGNIESNNPEKNNNDHSCFASGTIILTSSGVKEIEKVNIGDLVYTRLGHQPVESKFDEDIPKQTVTVGLTDKTKITCTPDHKFMTQRGFVEIQYITQDDYLYSIALEAFKLDLLKNFPKDPPIKEIIMKEIIWSSLGAKLNDDYHDLIGEDVRIILRLFDSKQKYAHELALWFIQCLENIRLYDDPGFCMNERKAIMVELLKEIDIYLKARRPLPEGLHGMKNQLKLLMINSYLNNKIATDIYNDEKIDINSITRLMDEDIRTNISWGEASLIKLYQKNLQKHTSFRLQNDLVVKIGDIRGNSELVRTYNLNIRLAHEYFANGMLVANCDALRYGMYGFKLGALPKNYGTARLKRNNRLR